jgi:hypothetical protein
MPASGYLPHIPKESPVHGKTTAGTAGNPTIRGFIFLFGCFNIMRILLRK